MAKQTNGKQKPYKPGRPGGRKNPKPGTNPKPGEQQGADIKDDLPPDGTNDPVWHAASPELKRLVAAIPFAQPVGVPFSVQNGEYSKHFLSTEPAKDNVPGILTLLVRPAIGDSSDANSPLNVATWAEFSALRKVLAGTFRFDPNDVMLFNLCTAQLYSALVELQRAYGLATQYTQENRYYVNAILHALGFDPLDVIEHLADFEYGINVLAHKIAAFNAPDFIDYFRYHAWLYKSIYSEGIGIKDQLYAYVPDGFWRFGLDSDGAGMAEFVQLPSLNRTVKQALDYVNSMLETMWFDEDNNVISAMIGKAYGLDKMIKVSEIDYTYKTETVAANYYVLSQFKNATVLPAQMAYATGYGNIVQDPTKQFLTYNAKYTIPTTAGYTGLSEEIKYSVLKYADESILVELDPIPTEDMVIESTRHTVQVDNVVISDTQVEFNIVCSTSIVVAGYVWWYDGNSKLHKTRIQTHIVNDSHDLNLPVSGIDFSQEEIDNYAMLLSKTRAFKYCPQINIYLGDETSSEGSVYTTAVTMRVIDYDNYTTIDHNELFNLHQVAIMSELGVLGETTQFENA